jgi:hypothetical protein
MIENQRFIIPQSAIYHPKSIHILSESGGIADCGLWISDCGMIENQRFIIPQSAIYNPKSIHLLSESGLAGRFRNVDCGLRND